MVSHIILVDVLDMLLTSSYKGHSVMFSAAANTATAYFTTIYSCCCISPAIANATTACSLPICSACYCIVSCSNMAAPRASTKNPLEERKERVAEIPERCHSIVISSGSPNKGASGSHSVSI